MKLIKFSFCIFQISERVIAATQHIILHSSCVLSELLSLHLNLKSLFVQINKYICPSFVWDLGYLQVKWK